MIGAPEVKIVAFFAFAVGALNNLTVRFLEISIQRLVVVTKGEVVHREAFVCRGHAIGCDCYLELFLLDLDIEALPLQVELRLDGKGVENRRCRFVCSGLSAAISLAKSGIACNLISNFPSERAQSRKIGRASCRERV